MSNRTVARDLIRNRFWIVL